MRDTADERLAEAVSFLTPETRAALAFAADGTAALVFPARNVALLSCGITGFSDHTRRLLASRSDGVEQLHEELRAHCDGLVSLILQAGGEPVAFIGDGLLSVWEAGTGGMAGAVRSAAALTQILADRRRAGAGTFDLNLHVTCGSMRTAELGGLNGR
jgi:class 3 adenylate cyclase